MRIRFKRAAAALAFSLVLPLAGGQDPDFLAPPGPEPPGQNPSRGSGGSSGDFDAARQSPGRSGGRGGPQFPMPRRPEARLRAEFQDNMKDAAALSLLAARLKREIEQNGTYVLSLETVKKTDEIEKLVKRIRDRMVHP